MLNHEWLRSFQVFAQHLNFTHAAQCLNISQPALHVQVKKLTEALGTPLYRKDGRRLELTEEGKKLCAFSGELQDRWQEFYRSLTESNHQTPVSLVAGQGAYLYLLGKPIAHFRRESNASLTLITADNLGCLDAVKRGQAHIGVTVLPEIPEDLTIEPLTTVPFMVAMPDNHPLASLDQIQAQQLVDFPLVLPPISRPHRIALEGVLGKHNLRVAVEAQGWELMIFFVGLGLGVAVVNGSCRMPEGVTRRPFLDLAPITYHLIHRKGACEGGSRLLMKKLLFSNLTQPR